MTIFIVGCSGMNGNFNCNPQSDGTCTPLGAINKQASQGMYNGDANLSPKNEINNRLSTQHPNGYWLATPHPATPIRYGETVQQIWIAPYKDDDDNYHEPSYLYTIVKKARWIGLPEKEIVEDE